MKRNIKKLTVLVIVATIAMFIVVAMASADEHRGKKAIHGEYAFNGTGACLFAGGGFSDYTHFVPKYGTAGVWQLGPNTWDGVYIFNKDGTGEINAWHRFVSLQGPNFPPPPATPSAGLVQMSWQFTYTVDRGEITFTYIPGTYVAKYLLGTMVGAELYCKLSESWTGRVSPDGKNIVVSLGVPLIFIPTVDQANTTPLTPYVELVCNFEHHGFRMDE